MKNQRIDVIATTISGSIQDWGKVKHIVPLFNKHGFDHVSLYSVDTHIAAREKARECLEDGCRIIISAGGSGTFNSVLEGCCDSGVKLDEIMLGFLRKGSADLIGKTLGMPDTIDEAISVFADCIENNKTIKCDIINANCLRSDAKARNFVGYGGAEIFGEIPTYTENRFIKYYKGIFSQIFGDLGPFFIGASLACINKSIKYPFTRKRKWKISVDGKVVSQGAFQAMIIVNGDLGKDLPLAKDVPLGSGDFYLFALRDIGIHKLVGQFKKTWNASVLEDPERWGFEKICIKETLKLQSSSRKMFKINIDGSTMKCQEEIDFRINGQINLISAIM